MDTAPTPGLRRFGRCLVVLGLHRPARWWPPLRPSGPLRPTTMRRHRSAVTTGGNRSVSRVGAPESRSRTPATASLGSAVQNGGAFVGHVTGGSAFNALNMRLSWQGAGTYYLPLPAGAWDVGATGTPAVGVLTVGAGEPPPPTTCSTVAQGTAATSVSQPLPWVSGIAVTMNGTCPGYWITSPTGAVNSVGGAALLGEWTTSIERRVSPPEGSPRRSTAPVVGIARTPDSNGYWLAASDGGVFAFGPGYFSTGDAPFYGSMGGAHAQSTHRRHHRHARPARATGSSASDGGVFAFGDAALLRLDGRHAPQPTHRRHHRHADRQGLLARRLRRWRLRLR